MKQEMPFLRFVANTNNLPNHCFTKAYDCRLLYVLSGSGELCLKDRRIPLETSSLVYYPSGLAYLPRSTSAEPMGFVTVNFDFDQAAGHIATVLPPVPEAAFEQTRCLYSQYSAHEIFHAPFLLENAAFLSGDMLRLCEAYGRGTAQARALASSILSVILLEIVERKSDPLAKNSVVAAVTEYVQRHYEKPINIKKIADEFGYHPYYLGRLFKAHAGESLHEYISSVRLRKSEELLRHTSQPVGQIAACCGFQNADHFSVCFSARYGCTPSAYRKEYKMI